MLHVCKMSTFGIGVQSKPECIIDEVTLVLLVDGGSPDFESGLLFFIGTATVILCYAGFTSALIQYLSRPWKTL